MKTLSQSYFLIFSIVFLTIFILQQFHYPLPSWINNYVNDFLCMPVVLTVCLVCVRLIKRNSTLLLPPVAIIALTVYYSVYFEYILPKNDPRYTADIMDVILYFMGGAGYYVLQRKNVSEEKKLHETDYL